MAVIGAGTGGLFEHAVERDAPDPNQYDDAARTDDQSGERGTDVPAAGVDHRVTECAEGCPPHHVGDVSHGLAGRVHTTGEELHEESREPDEGAEHGGHVAPVARTHRAGEQRGRYTRPDDAQPELSRRCQHDEREIDETTGQPDHETDEREGERERRRADGRRHGQPGDTRLADSADSARADRD